MLQTKLWIVSIIEGRKGEERDEGEGIEMNRSARYNNNQIENVDECLFLALDQDQRWGLPNIDPLDYNIIWTCS